MSEGWSLPGQIQNNNFFLCKISRYIGKPHWQISKLWKPRSLLQHEKRSAIASLKIRLQEFSVILEVPNFQKCSPAALLSLFLSWVLQSTFIGKQSGSFHFLLQHGWFIEVLEVVNDYQGTNILWLECRSKQSAIGSSNVLLQPVYFK